MNEDSARRWFGSNLRRFRKTVLMTQEVLSEKLGVTAQHLSYLETGSRSPSFEVIIAAANVFNISPSDLLMDTSKSLPGKHKEVVGKISQLTRSLSKDDQDRILKIISNCVGINRTKA